MKTQNESLMIEKHFRIFHDVFPSFTSSQPLPLLALGSCLMPPTCCKLKLARIMRLDMLHIPHTSILLIEKLSCRFLLGDNLDGTFWYGILTRRASTQLKSGYKAIMAFHNDVGPSNSLANEKWWNSLWNLPFPSKIKIKIFSLWCYQRSVGPECLWSGIGFFSWVVNEGFSLVLS